MKIYCPCGNEITTMSNCIKKANNYYCKRCLLKITDKKIKQLIERIKNDTAR